MPRQAGIFHRTPAVQRGDRSSEDGKSFKVIAHNNSRDNKYVRSIVLNGNKLETPFFTHQDIVDGGTLELTMGSEPLK